MIIAMERVLIYALMGAQLVAIVALFVAAALMLSYVIGICAGEAHLGYVWATS